MKLSALVEANISSGFSTADVQAPASANGSRAAAEPRLLVTADQPERVHTLCGLLRAFGFPVAVVHEEGDVIVRVLAYHNAHHLLVTGNLAGTALIQPLRLVERLRDARYVAPVHLHTANLTAEETRVCKEAGVDCTCCPAARNVSLIEGVNSLISAAPKPAACLSILYLRN